MTTTKIEYVDEVWNLETGCSKVSSGCKHCYAERNWKRLSANPKTVYYKRKFTDVKCHPEKLDLPLHWKKPRRVFVNSMSDLFHPDVPDSFIRAIWQTMALARQHTFLILTKRPERMSLFPWIYSGLTLREGMTGSPLPNVWLGVSVEDQQTADERIPLLLQTPAAVRFISAEPLLDPIDFCIKFDRWSTYDVLSGCGVVTGPGAVGQMVPNAELASKVDWVIAGGETGPKARPMRGDWVRSIRDQCVKAGTKFFFKSWGEWLPWTQFNGSEVIDDPEQSRYLTLEYKDDKWEDVGYPQWADWCDDIDGTQCVARVGKKLAGRLLDGRTWEEMPT
jgi:protein gp37